MTTHARFRTAEIPRSGTPAASRQSGTDDAVARFLGTIAPRAGFGLRAQKAINRRQIRELPKTAAVDAQFMVDALSADSASTDWSAADLAFDEGGPYFDENLKKYLELDKATRSEILELLPALSVRIATAIAAAALGESWDWMRAEAPIDLRGTGRIDCLYGAGEIFGAIEIKVKRLIPTKAELDASTEESEPKIGAAIRQILGYADAIQRQAETCIEPSVLFVAINHDESAWWTR